MANRQRTDIDEDAEEHVEGAWRRFEQGVEAMNAADEAEDYQGVGIKCREALIAVDDSLSEGWVGEVANAPKRSDVKGWGEVFARTLADGRVRGYIKNLFDTTWDLAVWLQHNKNATPWDAEVVLDAASQLISTLGMLVHRHGQGAPRRCPRCGSYRVSDAFEEVEAPEPGFTNTPVCASCDWYGVVSFTSWGEKDEQIAAYQARKAQAAADHEGDLPGLDDGLPAARQRDAD
jgi:hypothetical protein